MNTWQENYEECESQMLTLLHKEHLIYVKKFFGNIEEYHLDTDLLKYDKFSVYTNSVDKLPHLLFGTTSIGNFENIYMDVIIPEETMQIRHHYYNHRTTKGWSNLTDRTLNLWLNYDWLWLADTLNEIVASSENSKVV